MPERINIFVSTDDFPEEKSIVVPRADDVLIKIARVKNLNSHSSTDVCPCGFESIGDGLELGIVTCRESKRQSQCTRLGFLFKDACGWIFDPAVFAEKSFSFCQT